MVKIFAITGVSQSGRGAFIKYFQRYNFITIKTMTTRALKVGEDGDEYIEYAGNLYGSPANQFKINRNCVAVLDLRGCIALKNSLQICTTIRLHCTTEQLQQRMTERSFIKPEEMKMRMEESKKYLNYQTDYVLDATNCADRKERHALYHNYVDNIMADQMTQILDKVQTPTELLNSEQTMKIHN